MSQTHSHDAHVPVALITKPTDFNTEELFPGPRANMDGGTDPVQVCRTCTKSTIRSKLGCAPEVESDLIRLLADGTTAAADKDLHGSYREMTTPDGQVVKVFSLIPGKRVTKMAMTCGQQIESKCKGCARFRATFAMVPTGDEDSFAHPVLRRVMIGGHCSIPAGGQIINGKLTTCDRVPLFKDVLGDAQSCANCAYLEIPGNAAELYHTSPLDYALNAYERDLAATGDPAGIGMRMNEALKDKGRIRWPIGPGQKATSMMWVGLIRTYKALFLRTVVDVDGSEAGIEVRLPGIGKAMIVWHNPPADDPQPGIVDVRRIDERFVALVILAPWTRNYGLPDADWFTYPRYPQQSCADCDGTGKVTELVTFASGPRVGERDFDSSRTCGTCGGAGTHAALPASAAMRQTSQSHPPKASCAYCTEVPCYFHAKGRIEAHEVADVEVQVDGRVIGTIRLDDGFNPPSTKTTEHNPARTLRLDRGTGTVADAAGNPPDPAVFRVWLRSILEWCHSDTELEAKVMAQYHAAMDTLARSKRRQPNLSWNRAAIGDPYVPSCAVHSYDLAHGGNPAGSDSHNYPPSIVAGKAVPTPAPEAADLVLTRGLDFQGLWNDRFGTPRQDRSTNTMMDLGGRLVRDPRFSQSQADERDEWERVTNPGEAVQAEYDETQRWLRSTGEEYCAAHQLSTLPAGLARSLGATVVEPTVAFTRRYLGAVIPEAKISFAQMRDWCIANGHVPAGSDVADTAWVVEYLHAQVFVPADTDAGRIPGWSSHHAMILGWDDFKNSPGPESEAASVWRTFHVAGPDDNLDAADEIAAGFYCSVCNDGSTGVGFFGADEVTNAALDCPNGCGGKLSWHSGTAEWRLLRMGAEQITADMAYKPYQRAGSPSVAVADSARWSQEKRLRGLVCGMWRRRGW